MIRKEVKKKKTHNYEGRETKSSVSQLYLICAGLAKYEESSALRWSPLYKIIKNFKFVATALNQT